MTLWFAGTPAFAQSSTNETNLFQARIKEAAQNFAGRPAFKNLSAADREKLMDFVVGNMLFVILHELGHAAITEMGLPVLGRPEDAADSFAVLTGLDAQGNTSFELTYPTYNCQTSWNAAPLPFASLSFQ